MKSRKRSCVVAIGALSLLVIAAILFLSWYLPIYRMPVLRFRGEIYEIFATDGKTVYTAANRDKITVERKQGETQIHFQVSEHDIRFVVHMDGKRATVADAQRRDSGGYVARKRII